MPIELLKYFFKDIDQIISDPIVRQKFCIIISIILLCFYDWIIIQSLFGKTLNEIEGVQDNKIKCVKDIYRNHNLDVFILQEYSKINDEKLKNGFYIEEFITQLGERENYDIKIIQLDGINYGTAHLPSKSSVDEFKNFLSYIAPGPKCIYSVDSNFDLVTDFYNYISQLYSSFSTTEETLYYKVTIQNLKIIIPKIKTVKKKDDLLEMFNLIKLMSLILKSRIVLSL